MVTLATLPPAIGELTARQLASFAAGAPSEAYSAGQYQDRCHRLSSRHRARSTGKGLRTIGSPGKGGTRHGRERAMDPAAHPGRLARLTELRATSDGTR